MNEVLKILQQSNVTYTWYDHEPIYTYEDALRVDKQHNITGVETKNLFLKSKNNDYYIFLTTVETQFDAKVIKELTGEKLKIASSDDLVKTTNYSPGSCPQFPYDENIIYIIDENIFDCKSLICSGGTPTCSFTISGSDIKKIIANIKNKKIFLNAKNFVSKE